MKLLLPLRDGTAVFPGQLRNVLGVSAMTEAPPSIALRLNDLLAKAGLEILSAETAAQFADYCGLLLHWNARINLTAVRDEDGILSRHFVESVACARALPPGIATLLDFGSGAGLPGIPIALCRPEIAVTLAESHGKKAAFLREAVRTLRLSTVVHSARAELLTKEFDCVTLRAVDRMPEAVKAACRLAAPGGWLALMTTSAAVTGLKAAAGPDWCWSKAVILPDGDERTLALGTRRALAS